MNYYLLKAEKLLKKDYFLYSPTDNIIVVSVDKAVLPFMKIIWDENYPKNLLLSFATDYINSSEAANLALMINKITNVKLMEDYYIAKNGNMYFGHEASKYYAYDTQLPLDEIEPECDTRH